MIIAVDLFCGAGGTSTGLAIACRKRGIPLDLTAINHWDTAINTHSVNHPSVRHLCEPIELIKPREVVKGHLDLLIASPECTHHSNARGGKPINDQSRATAFRVLEWAEALSPAFVLIENVPEFRTWGPIDAKGKRKRGEKGAIYIQFLEMLRALGYQVEDRILNAADYGDPTTRRRNFVIARRGQAAVPWPAQTHCCPKKLEGLFSDLKPWRPARDIIDFTIESQSIFRRKKPLARKTIERTLAGAMKFGWPEWFLVILRNHMDGRSTDEPIPTIAAGGQHVALASVVLDHPTSNRAKVRSEADPLLTIRPSSSTIQLEEPFLARYNGGEDRTHSVDEPVPVVDCSNRYGAVEAFILPHRKFEWDCQDSIERPLRTIDATNGRQIGVVEGFIVPGSPRTHDIDDPLPTVTAQGHQQLAEPIVERYNGNGGSIPTSEPLPTVTAKDRFAVAEPILVDLCHGNGSEDPSKAARRRSQSLDEPTVGGTCANGKALVEGVIVANDGDGCPFLLKLETGQAFGLDVRLRMLKPKELAAAMSFPPDYQFVGNSGQIVRQIGNAVPVGIAEALCGAILDTCDIGELTVPA